MTDKSYVDVQARLLKTAEGYAIYLFKGPNKGYAVIQTDLEVLSEEDTPEIGVAILKRGDESNTDSWAGSISTPEDLNDFFKKALEYLGEDKE